MSQQAVDIINRITDALLDSRCVKCKRMAVYVYPMPPVPPCEQCDKTNALIREARALVHKHEENPNGASYYAITGRIPGDDEDTGHVFESTDYKSAINAFTEKMYENCADTDLRKNVEEHHGTCIYATSIFKSDAPIEIV